MEINKNKKRRRGREEEEDLMKNAKKLLDHSNHTIDESNKEKHKQDDDDGLPVGVFNFPWLKEEEAAMFKADDYFLDFQDTFAFALAPAHCNYSYDLCDNEETNCSTLITTGGAGLECCYHLGQSKDDGDDDDEAVWPSFSSQVDDERDNSLLRDGIWSSVLDQPLDIGFNKL